MGGKGLEPLLVCKTRGMADRKAIVGSIPTVPLQKQCVWSDQTH